MKNYLTRGLASLPLAASLFLAATQTAQAEEDRLTIVITASRSAETVDETMAPVTVITRDEIQATGLTSVSEVLATVPGVVISSNGGRGQTTSLFLRGTESDHTLVLIDGVRAGSATLGTFPYQDMPLDQIEKIEVVRGPRSSLYGSEAIGGVIQIFTRKGGKGTQPSFHIGGGSNGTTDLGVGISGGNASQWYAINASRYKTDGFNVCQGDFTAGCFTVEPDDDGYENTGISLRGGTQLGENTQLEAGLLNSDGEVEFDGSFQNESETLTRVAHVKLNTAVTDIWNASLLIADSADESENFLNGTFASRFETSRQQISLQNDLLVGESSKLILGLDYIDDEVDSDNPFEVSSRDNTGIFASFDTQIGATDLNVSLRNDDNEQFGSESTGGIAVGRELGNGVRGTASYGTAFKAPTFHELFFPDFGNPDLEAETSESIDIGLSGRANNINWSVNVFKTTIDDLIGFDPTTFLPVNIDQAEITGVEMGAAWQAQNWRVSGNVTLQNPEDTSGGVNDGNQLARRAEQMISLRVERMFERANVGLGITHRGSVFDDLANINELDSFTIVDLNAEYQVTAQWALGLKVSNLFDEEYETARLYNQDGLNALLTLRYKPQR